MTGAICILGKYTSKEVQIIGFLNFVAFVILFIVKFFFKKSDSGRFYCLNCTLKCYIFCRAVFGENMFCSTVKPPLLMSLPPDPFSVDVKLPTGP